MTIAEAMLVFTVEVTRASAGRVTTPTVHGETLDSDRVIANHPWQGRININWHTLWVASDWPDRKSRPWLRCIARHEVAHDILKHAPRTLDERDKNEAEVGPFMLATWGEPNPICTQYLK